MKDALKGYLALASGLTEVTRQRATSAAKALVAQGEATAGQVSGLADDLVSQSRSNREAVAALVKYEVDRALGLVGLASSDEVGELTARVRALETAVRELSQRTGSAAPSATGKAAAGQADAAAAPATKAAPAHAGPAKAAPGKAPARPSAPAKPVATGKAGPAKAPVQASAALAATTAAANTATPSSPVRSGPAPTAAQAEGAAKPAKTPAKKVAKTPAKAPAAKATLAKAPRGATGAAEDGDA